MIVKMNSKYKVSLTVGVMGEGKLANTSERLTDNSYRITFNPNAAQNSLNNAIFISTLYHELLHVKIQEMYWEIVKGKEYVDGAENIHPKLFEYLHLYGKYEDKKDLNDNYIQRGWSHNYMADYGRLDIIKAMKQQDLKDNVVDRSGEINGIKYTSEEWYDAISWAGLDGTESWNKLADDKKKLYLSLIKSDVDNAKKAVTPDINENNSDSTKTGG